MAAALEQKVTSWQRIDPQQIIKRDPRIITKEQIDDFFMELGLQYASGIIVPEEFKEFVHKNAEKSKRYFEQTAEPFQFELSHLAQEARKNPEILPRLLICSINEEIGYGCFAERQIRGGTLIGEYAGLLGINKNHSSGKYKVSYNPSFAPVRHPGGHLCVDAEHLGNESRFINHFSKSAAVILPNKEIALGPNVRSVWGFYGGLYRSLLYARRDIGAGEELRFDYGRSYYRTEENEPENSFYHLDLKKISLVELVTS